LDELNPIEDDESSLEDSEDFINNMGEISDDDQYSTPPEHSLQQKP